MIWDEAFFTRLNSASPTSWKSLAKIEYGLRRVCWMSGILFPQMSILPYYMHYSSDTNMLVV